jgi:hypothetical protein
MPSNLPPGHTLWSDGGEFLESDDRRFQLRMLSSAQVALYAFISAPLERRLLWASPGLKTTPARASASMGKDGVLRIEYIAKPLGAIKLKMAYPWHPVFHRPAPELSAPNAQFVVRIDGRVEISGQGSLGKVYWEWPIAPRIKGAIIPNTPTVILPPGSLSIQTNKTLVNDSNVLIGVSDGDAFKPLDAGHQTGISAIGALNVSMSTFRIDPVSGAAGGVDDALASGATTQFAPGTRVIRVSEVGSSKFKLTGV